MQAGQHYMEYAAVEPGHEGYADWIRSRDQAKARVKHARDAGQSCHLIQRQVSISPWARTD